MKKNSKESEINSQKQTGRKTVKNPRQTGASEFVANNILDEAKEDMKVSSVRDQQVLDQQKEIFDLTGRLVLGDPSDTCGPSEEVQGEADAHVAKYSGVAVKTQKFLDAEKEHMLNQLEKDTKAVIALTDGYAQKVMDGLDKRGAGCEMDDDGDGNCAIHLKGCPDVANGGRPTVTIKDDLEGITPEMIEEFRPKQLTDEQKAKMDSLWTGDCIDVSKYIGGMDPANGDSVTITTTLEAAAVENLEVEFEAGLSHGEIQHNRIGHLVFNGFTDEGIFLRHEHNGKVMLINKEDLSDNKKFGYCISFISEMLDDPAINGRKSHAENLEKWAKENPVKTPDWEDSSEDYFSYQPELIERTTIGGEDLLACSDTGKDVIYIPVQHVLNPQCISYPDQFHSEPRRVVMRGATFQTTNHLDNPGCIMIPMWMAELKHLV